MTFHPLVKFHPGNLRGRLLRRRPQLQAGGLLPLDLRRPRAGLLRRGGRGLGEVDPLHAEAARGVRRLDGPHRDVGRGEGEVSYGTDWNDPTTTTVKRPNL